MTNRMTTMLALCVTITMGVDPAIAAGFSDTEFANAASRIQFKGLQTQRRSDVPIAAAVRAAESVVRDQTTAVDVALNAKTVKCSAADYQMPMLKVLVPGLADLTVLNHRNTREGAPCIAAGRCSETLNPAGLLQPGEGTEIIPIRVVLKKNTQVDSDVCRVWLTETVTASIRGVPFFHERTQEVAERAAGDCR